MAEKQATDDDDEESFGDFTFASFPSPMVYPNAINGQDGGNGKDDEWGDFINHSSQALPFKEYPLGFGFPNGLPHTLSLPRISEKFDPVGVSPMKRAGSDPIQEEPEKGLWERPRGALPLSIFGEEDEEGGSVVNSAVGGDSNLFSDQLVDSVKNTPRVNAGVAINVLIANLYSQSEQIEAENVSNSNFNDSSSNLNDSNYKSHVTESIVHLDGTKSSLDGLNSILNGSNLNGLDSMSNGLNLEFVDVNEDFDDYDGWEFQGAYKESGSEKCNSKEEVGATELLGLQVQSRTVDREIQNNSKRPVLAFEFVNGVTGSNDLFAMSNGFSSNHSESEIGIDFKPTKAAQNGFISNSYNQSMKNDMENGLFPNSADGMVNPDDDLWEFKDAFSETTPKPEEEPNAAVRSHTAVEELAFDGETLESKVKSESNKGALPLSLFSEGIADTDDSLNLQDDFIYTPTSFTKISINSHGSNQPINDLISNLYSQSEQVHYVDSASKHTENGSASTLAGFDCSIVNGDDDDFDDCSWVFKEAFPETGVDLISNLYSQTEQIQSVDLTPKPTENGSSSPQAVLDSGPANGVDNFDGNSWEFKEAFLETRVEDQNSILSLGDAHKTFSTKLELDNCMDFYSKLKDELCSLTLCHLENLKKTKNIAALSGEEAKIVALNEETQEACKVLQQEQVLFEEASPDTCPPRHAGLNDFFQVLQEPKFHMLESEYDLSRSILLAEKDLRSAVELLKHASSILKILRLGSREEQSSYVSIWSKVLSVCAQELKHGALIWKQSLQKNVQSQILSEPRGQHFIFSLGEVYRVVEVLGASAKLYKPWMLLGFADFTGIFALLKECSDLWSRSGLEEALQIISDPIGLEYNGTNKTLLESIKYIHDLDVISLQNLVFSQKESICKLSLLTQETIPEMKMVTWNGEPYFLKNANLWANLISSDPPELPHTHAG